MNQNPSLVARGVSKVYQPKVVRKDGERRRLFGPRTTEARPADVQAVKNVSLTLLPGRIYGVIGGRGSGKTTLLRVLAGLTPLTEGRVEGCGKVTGLFDTRGMLDGALTGRENILAQAAALGWSKSDIDPYIDEIARFAGLERFIDVKVARYSKGMSLRLGFSFAVTVRPNILFIDDVLAVGDLAFQQTCLDRLRQCADEGATIVIAASDMNHVMRLCDEVVWLAGGQVRAIGSPTDIVPQYVATVFEPPATAFGPQAESEFGRIVDVRIADAALTPIRLVTDEHDLVVQVGYEAFAPTPAVRVGLTLYWEGNLVVISEKTYTERNDAGLCWFAVTLPRALLSRRSYTMNISVTAIKDGSQALMKVEQACSFRVLEGPSTEGKGRADEANALMRAAGEWAISPLS